MSKKSKKNKKEEPSYVDGLIHAICAGGWYVCTRDDPEPRPLNIGRSGN